MNKNEAQAFSLHPIISYYLTAPIKIVLFSLYGSKATKAHNTILD
jgi:hypothetical protein